MLKQLKQLTRQLVAGANVGTVVLMLLVGYSDRLSPASFPMLATVGLAFPVLLAVNMGFLLLWLLFKPRYALIPIGGLLLAYQPVRNYCPLNLPTTTTDSTLTIVSFNAYNERHLPDSTFRRGVTDYLLACQADLVCLQELALRDADMEVLAATYTYADTVLVTRSGDPLVLISRHPIVGHRKIFSTNTANPQPAAHSVAFFVDWEGDTLVVINNHLESTRLDQEERTNFRRIVNGSLQRDSAEQESKRLIERLAESTRARQPQVDALTAYLDSLLAASGQQPVILCGDFNDSPISYAHHAVARRLADCYAESGNGPGITYHENALYVRIDHIFCSHHLSPVATHVDREMTLSDHYPLVSKLKKAAKP